LNLEALFALNCGMYVVASSYQGKMNGLIINALVQVTAFPPQIVASVNKESLTVSLIEKSGFFSVSVLEKEAPLQLVGLFGFRTGRDIDKFSQVKYFLGKTGVPVLAEHTVAYVEARVVSRLDAGTHMLFLGEVVETEFIDSNLTPMTYGYYRDVKGGKVPRTAATYQEKKESAAEKTGRYRCKVCGYIYDERFGDPDSNVPPGTPFEELPEGWVCPICGVGKDQFEKL